MVGIAVCSELFSKRPNLLKSDLDDGYLSNNQS